MLDARTEESVQTRQRRPKTAKATSKQRDRGRKRRRLQLEGSHFQQDRPCVYDQAASCLLVAVRRLELKQEAGRPPEIGQRSKAKTDSVQTDSDSERASHPIGLSSDASRRARAASCRPRGAWCHIPSPDFLDLLAGPQRPHTPQRGRADIPRTSSCISTPLARRGLVLSLWCHCLPIGTHHHPSTDSTCPRRQGEQIRTEAQVQIRSASKYNHPARC